ncbi:MAG: carnitine dehydratase [Deltaproteobacteria bacterium HGW-Deltaproteobacteria-12]|jgi:crotonobetainyl-CoA:carnitine CoA-transferase CaiB-like acyl-CoA transferase|nr:MAG: carnitine dehydratase [Deltaproteobacteria bacterium HGW-Deltaproteobacteria-12]
MTLPLTGLRILDFSHFIPGPLATLHLADMGAQVLKIVSRYQSDAADLQPLFLDSDISANAAYLERNKRSMYLNLKDPRAQKIVYQLIMHYDILIEQFRPGTMAEFGLDYATLSRIHPSLIYCALTGYGQTGPQAGKAGQIINFLARSGSLNYLSPEDSGRDSSGEFLSAAASGAAHTIIGILAAVIGRSKTGHGQYIDIALTDSMTTLNNAYAASLITSKSPEPESTSFNAGYLSGCYETADGKYMSVGSLLPGFRSVFFEAINRPDLVTAANGEEVKKQIGEIFRRKKRDEWTKIFRRVDACVEPVLNAREALDDEQSQERNIYVDIDLPQGGKVRQPTLPIKFSSYKPEYKKIGAADGANTKEVLQELGYTEEQIAEMEKTGLLN